MKQPLADKVVIVTGASSGIGAAAAAAFAGAGARVALAARNAERLAALARKLGALAVTTDVTRVEDCDRLVRLAAEKFGRIDVLVNNAGIGHRCRFDELSEADARRIVEVNVFGVMNATRAVLPWMRQQKSGVIINIASAVAHIGTPLLSVYCATKFAVRGLSQSLDFELADEGIHVVNFCPGYTETEFFQNAVARKGRWKPGLSKGMTAEAVARRIVDAAIRPRPEIVLSWDGRLQALGARYCPGLLRWVARRFFSKRAEQEAAEPPREI